jgi:hypothetical protein
MLGIAGRGRKDVGNKKTIKPDFFLGQGGPSGLRNVDWKQNPKKSELEGPMLFACNPLPSGPQACF